jgi:hypothetical protein
VKEIRFALDGAAEVAAPGAAADVNVTTDGRHDLAFHAVDLGDNAEAQQQTVAFAIDATPPVTTASVEGTTGANGWYRPAVTVALTALDPASSVGALGSRVEAAPGHERGRRRVALRRSGSARRPRPSTRR